MLINPYGAEPVRLAARLADERPRTPAELQEICDDEDVVGGLPPRPADVRQLDELLDAWLTVVDAPDDRARARRLNRLLARYAEHPRLTDHTGTWHLHYRPERVGLARLLATMITVGTALHLTERGMDRLGRCAAPDCRRAYADTSRNGTQRFCCQRCGTREAVRRHRARA
ncbi:CGNR zinc finger domain-containing protein [Naumannella huperziae]